MILQEINSTDVEIRTVYKKGYLKVGNNGLPYLQLVCTDCLVLVFDKDISLFENDLRVGCTFTAVVKKYGEIFNFKYFTGSGIVKRSINSKPIENSSTLNDGNWLEDAAGSSDPDVMNDAYWNID